MCLGVPGKIVRIESDPLGMIMGMVSFGGIVKEVCLAYVPEAEVGDFVVVHVGFAISRIDQEEAARVFEALKELGELEGIELDPGEPADGATPVESETPSS